MKKVTVGLTMALIATVMGCKKEEQATTTTTEAAVLAHLKLGASDQWRHAANPENPLDNVGLGHNQCLSAILSQVPMAGLTDPRAVYEAAFEHGMSHYGEQELRALRDNFSPNDLGGIYATIAGGIPDQAYVLEVSGLRGDARMYLATLLSEVYTEEAAALPLEQLKQIIVDWESGIVSATSNGQERAALYAFGSTLRYSLYAWVDAEFPENGDEHVELRRLRLFGWIATAVFDAVGGAMGTVAGGPVGGVIAGAACSGGCAAVCAYNGW